MFFYSKNAFNIHILFTNNQRQSIERRAILEHYDLVVITHDEIIDNGVIMDLDPTTIVQRVSKPPVEDFNINRIDLSEQGIQNLTNMGKTRLANWLRQGL